MSFRGSALFLGFYQERYAYPYPSRDKQNSYLLRPREVETVCIRGILIFLVEGLSFTVEIRSNGTEAVL